MQWIGMQLPVLRDGREVLSVAAVPYDHRDGANQLLALQRASNVARLCIVTAEDKRMAEREAAHVFRRRERAVDQITFAVDMMSREEGTLYTVIKDAVHNAMLRANGVQKDAAVELGVSPRVLNHMLARLGMNHWRPMVIRRMRGLKVAQTG